MKRSYLIGAFPLAFVLTVACSEHPAKLPTSCSEAGSLQVQVSKWGLSKQLSILGGKKHFTERGVAKFTLYTYAGKLKPNDSLADGEYNLVLTLYTNNRGYPRKQVKGGMKFGMPSAQYHHNSASYRIHTKGKSTYSWWNVLGTPGTGNLLAVQLKQLSHTGVCMEVSGRFGDHPNGEVAGSSLQGTVNVSF